MKFRDKIWVKPEGGLPEIKSGIHNDSFEGKRFWDIFTQKVAESSIGVTPDIRTRPKQVIDLNTIRQDKYKLMTFSVTQMELNKALKQNPGWQ